MRSISRPILVKAQISRIARRTKLSGNVGSAGQFSFPGCRSTA